MSIEPGCKVRVVGLRGRSDLNGQAGVVLEPAHSEMIKIAVPVRWLVALDGPGAEELALSEANLEVIGSTFTTKATQATFAFAQRWIVTARGSRSSLPLTYIAILTFVALSLGILGGAASREWQEGVEFGATAVHIPP